MLAYIAHGRRASLNKPVVLNIAPQVLISAIKCCRNVLDLGHQLSALILEFQGMHDVAMREKAWLKFQMEELVSFLNENIDGKFCRMFDGESSDIFLTSRAVELAIAQTLEATY